MSNAHTCSICARPTSRTPFRFERFQVRACVTCSVAFVHVHDASVEPQFDATYLGYLMSNTSASEQFFDAVLPRLRALEPTGKVLDVGFGAATFLLKAVEAGYEVTGVEVSGAACEHARRLGLSSVACGDLLDLDLPAEAFDVVTFWDSLQCTPDAVAYLRRARELLRPGGVLVVQVPNRGELNYRFARALQRAHPKLSRSFLHVPAARTLFSEDGLRAALDHTGYSTIDVFGDPRTRTYRWSGRPTPSSAVRNLIENGFLLLEKRAAEKHPLIAMARRAG